MYDVTPDFGKSLNLSLVKEAPDAGEDFVGLMDNVEEVRRRRQHENIRLLQELEPHLRAARTVERELDRQLARRFRVFRYLRDDELGLSRIIADLLDPAAEHGQGTIFLEAMLELLAESPDASGARTKAADGANKGAAWKRHSDRLDFTAVAKIRVEVEREITARRRIDITVDIPTEDGPFCLAFENKPYADDQPGQCRDYLKFLARTYGGHFLLVYLPPRYRMPDKSSLPLKDRECWKNHFFVLPYCYEDAPHEADDASDGGDEELAQDVPSGDGATTADADAPPADGPSLADWFSRCLALCDAERLRWFLREGQLYCQQQFGDLTMTDPEANHIREYLEENSKHLPAAFAVARAWPAIKHDVCRRFLEHLTDRVTEEVRKALPKMADGLTVACHYGMDKRYASYLCVYRDGWVRHDGALDPKSDVRATVMLECGSSGPSWWCWGVRLAKADEERSQEIESVLGRHGLSLSKKSSRWPQWEETRHPDWTAIVPELFRELPKSGAKGGGKFTDYYVKELLDIAEKAIPAIDQFERQKGTSSNSRDS